MILRTPFLLAKATLLLVILGHLSPKVALAQSLGLWMDLVVDSATSDADFLLAGDGYVAPIYVSASDYKGVARAVSDLQEDVEAVTSNRPEVVDSMPIEKWVVLVGTIGRSEGIDRLASEGKLDVRDLEGKWESFAIEVVENPYDGVDKALVIAGSDKRGTIYGVYELSEQLGVSPWHWWADVSPRKRDLAYVVAGRYLSGEPKVKYRGIFLNNEAPCLTGWAEEKFGGLNSQFYQHVFELLLRLRANYLWPAMWNNAFNEDDPENPRLADEYGIVMGTSHHEPMMRAHKEWTKRSSEYGNGKWNYQTNSEALKRFFREGIARNKAYENLVTIGMRGDGDEGMVSTGGIESDIAQLEKIFTDQRQILSEELEVPAGEIPQLWALFTEVQKFYEAGLRPPEDVTLLWTDDNAGNLRRVPTEEERKRSGGAGIYYHFDMHGGPYAYQWTNTFSFSKIQEQMNLAVQYGADRIWIVNVGDLKPLELPIEFFLRMAWDPAKVEKDRLLAYTRRWAARDFGEAFSEEIADIVSLYTKYNCSWRKPELVKPETYSQLHYREAERVEASWSELAKRAERLYRKIPDDRKDAYYQLVLHPVKSSALVTQINVLAGRNHLYVKQGRASANLVADRVRALFREDQALSDYYNHELAGGKWNHLMDQAHLGQSSWEPPIVNIMPPVSETLPRANRDFGISVEGAVNTWPDSFGPPVLPVLESLYPNHTYIDVYGIGSLPFDHSIEAEEPWILLRKEETDWNDLRYWVEIDWDLAPVGSTRGTVRISGSRGAVLVQVPIVKATEKERRAANGRFASLSGPIAFDAFDAASRSATEGASWQDVPDYGRVQSGVSIFPVDAESILNPMEAPCLEYPLYLAEDGSFELTLELGPVMDFVPERGMRIAVSLDGSEWQVLDIFEDREAETFLGRGWWNQFTRDNVRYLKTTLDVAQAGPQLLKIAMVDPGIVLQRIRLSPDRIPESYFGPPSRGRVE